MFITLEGIEGSGKTTLIENLADVFRTLNHEVLVTRERRVRAGPGVAPDAPESGNGNLP